MASLKTTGEINIQLGRITVPESDVELEGKRLGNGSYGTVFMVKYRGEPCAAKEIHSLLFEETEEKLNLLDVFSRECCQCSELIHPNIVKFIGVYFPNKQLLPVMLMELMDKSLRAYLEGPQTQVTLVTKSSVLIDIAEGLSYLHYSNPPVVHRDLTPNNILLTLPWDKDGVPVAKISDLGVARAIETNKNIRQRLTKLPGSPGFMPPEAFHENPDYNTSLDVFSYGGVVLFVANQIWPDPSAPNSYDRKTNKLVAFTEVQCRQRYLNQMKNGTEIWRSTVEACLSNDPDERPEISQVSERLKSFKLTMLQDHVKSLVHEIQQEGKCYSDYQLECQFEGHWKEWMNSFTPNSGQLIEYPSDSEIEDEIVKILRQQLLVHDVMLVQKLVTKTLNERSCSLQFLIDKDVHLTSTRWMGFGSLGNDDTVVANQLTEECLTSARSRLNSIKIEIKPFTSKFAYEVIKSLFKSIDDVMRSKKKSGFEFKPEYKVDVAIAMCACASSVFKQTTRKVRDNNPVIKLNKIKGVFLNMFKELYKDINRSDPTPKVNGTGEQKIHKDKAYTVNLFIIMPIIFILIAIAWLYIS